MAQRAGGSATRRPGVRPTEVGHATLSFMKQRCSECRLRFEPAATARTKQRVCGSACRNRRRARLARQRRRADLDGCRADERERQRQHRARVRATSARAGPPSRASPSGPDEGSRAPICHEPASASKGSELQDELEEMVARMMRVSRATLEREMARFSRRIVQISAGKWEPARDRSRTSSGP